MRALRALLLAVLLAGAAGLAQAQTPISISADTFTVNEAAGEAQFSGNVTIERDGLNVWADKVVVAYGPGGPQNITSFLATGAVRLKTADQEATGDRASFDPATQILRLTGNVVVVNAAGTLRGPELEINLAASTSVFSGGEGGRVTGVFNTR